MTSKKQIFLWKLVSHSCFYTIIWNRLCYSISGLIQISGLIFLCKVWSNNNKNMRLKWHLVIVVVQSLSHVWLFVTPWTAECQAFLSFTISWSLLKLMPIELVMLSNHLIFSHSLLLLPSIFPSIRVFFNESALLIRWPKYWSFSISVSPCNEYSGLISFRIDWFELFAVQGILKSLLQHHSSKASIFPCSAIFMVQLSHT